MSLRSLIVTTVIGTLAVVLGVWATERRRAESIETLTIASASPASTCADSIKISNRIAALASDDDSAKDAATELLAVAKASGECRREVIDKLIRAMNKPDLNFGHDRPSFLLWRHGALILGKLRAVESLDMLIDHLDLNDRLFSASMYHQPAVAGVEAMGSMAIPKLRNALLNHKNKHVRLAAALCLFDIGGQDATEALRSALSSELDPCVQRFLELCFQPPTSEVLRQRLLAFNCSN